MTSSSTAAPAGTEQSELPPVESDRRPDALTVVPTRNPWRWVGTALVAVVLVGIGWSLFTNPRWQWDVVAQWLRTSKTVKPRKLNTPRIIGVEGNPGIAT